MPNKNYIKGYAAERKCRELLLEEGYASIRSAGSHGGVDIFSWSILGDEMIEKPLFRAIQVKVGKLTNSQRKEAEEKIISESLPAMVSLEIWVFSSINKPPEILESEGEIFS